MEKELQEKAKKVNESCGIRESDTGLAPPSQWDIVSDKQVMSEEQPLHVCFFLTFLIPGRCLVVRRLLTKELLTQNTLSM